MRFLLKNYLLVFAGLLIFSPIGQTQQQSVTDDGHVQAAIQQYQSGNRGNAIRRLLKLGYGGNIAAQVNLGIINFLRDDSVIARKEAKFWFGKAAHAGDTSAQFNLSMLLIEQPEDESRALSAYWLERSAEGGNVYAQTNFGILSVWHAGFRNSRVDGPEWLRLAAAAGDGVATAIIYDLPDASEEQALGLLHPIELGLRSQPSLGQTGLRSAAPVYVLPSVSIPAVMRLPEDAQVEVISKSSGWVKVRLPSGLPGWIQAEAVAVEDSRAFVKKLETGLYVEPRLEPSVHKFGVVTKGETLKILQRSGDWLRVEAPVRIYGWIEEMDVALLVASVKPGAETRPLPEIKQEVSKEALQVIKQFLPAGRDPNAYGQTLMSLKTTNEMVVFSEPGQSGRAIASVPANQQILVGAGIGGSSLVIVTPSTGWVLSSLISGDFPDGVSSRNNAQVRAKPTTGSDVVSTLQQGQAVKLLEQQDGWYRIAMTVQSGWVSTAVIEVIKNTMKDQTVRVEQIEQGISSDNTLESISPFNLVIEPVTRVSAPEPSPGTPRIGYPPVVDSTDELITAAEKVLSVMADAIVYSADSTTPRPLGRLVGSTDKVTQPGRRGMIPLSESLPVYGWVYRKLVDASDQQGVVKNNGVRIRLDPDTSRDNIVTTRAAGDSLQILSRQGGWLKVALPAVFGWVDPGAAAASDINEE